MNQKSHEILIGSYLVASKHQAPSFISTKPPGPSLEETMTRWPRQRLVASLDTLCVLLTYLHEHGIVHGNLHPKNISFAEDGTVCLWGLEGAYLFNKGVWASKERSGRLGYLAPEVAREEEVIDRRADLFSLGVILYEALTGQRPFQGKNHLELLLATLEHAPTPPGVLCPDCPPALSALCLTLLSKNKEERPHSSARVQEALLETGFLDWANATTLAPPPAPQETIAAKAQVTPPPISALSSEDAPVPFQAPPITPKLPEVSRATYSLREEIARGGLGKITRAIDTRLARQVAVKSLLSEKGTSRERFLREALLTAKLQHPSIIPIYEAGLWPGGAPFYSMPLVSGKPLHHEIALRKTLRERLALLPNVIAAAEAIAYAHAVGVIHRDLKPHNILIGEYGETIVIDWGLAKELGNRERGVGNGEKPEKTEGEESDASGPIPPTLTQTGSILGTPAYMPPEQVHAREVDERADVYALGAVLYHTLSGEPPYRGKSGGEALKAMLLSAPTPLSQKQPDLPRDLVAIVEKAMARNPRERYPSAKEMARDLQKFQAGQLVGVYQYTPAELLRRWFRRHRLTISIASALLLALLVGGVYSYIAIRGEKEQAERAQEQAERNEAEAKKERLTAEARSNSLILMQARNALRENRNLALAWLKTLLPSAPGWGGARLLAADALRRGGLLRASFSADVPLIRAELSPDGSQLVALGADQSLRVFDTKDGASQTLTGPQKYFVTKLLFSPVAPLLAVAGDTDIHLWETQSGQEKRFSGHSSATTDLAFSPDGKWLASASVDKTVRVFLVETGASRLLSGNLDMVSRLSFSPDGKIVAAVSADYLVYFWNIETGASWTLSGHSAPITQLGFSPDGRLFVTASFDAKLRLWELGLDGKILEKPPRLLSGHKETVTQFVFSSDGKTLASGSNDNTVRLWDINGEREAKVLSEHEGNVGYLAFAPDGKTLVDVGSDAVRIWDIERSESFTLVGPEDRSFVRLSSDGLLLASGNRQKGVLSLFQLGAQGSSSLPLPQDLAFLMRASPGGGFLVSPRPDARVLRLHNLKTKEAKEISHPGALVEVAFLSEELLATASTDKIIRLFQTQYPAEAPRLFLGHTGAPLALAASPDGESLASGDTHGELRLWDISTGQARLFSGHTKAIQRLAFSPDGAALLSASTEDKTLRLWEVSSGSAKTIATLASPLVVGPIFSPDGRYLAWAEGQRVYLFSRESGERRAFSGHTGAISSLVFSPDGALLASAGFDQRVRLWRVESGVSRVFSGHTGPVRALAFSNDGKTLASAGFDQSVRFWELSTGIAQLLKGHKDQVTQLAFTPGAEVLFSASLDWEVRRWEAPFSASTLVESGPVAYSWVEHDYRRHVAFSPDRKTLASTGYDQRVYLFDLLDGSSRVLEGHTGYVTRLAFSKDGKTLATAGLDHTIRLWEVESGQSRVLTEGELTYPTLSLAFSPDGKTLAASDESALRLWEVESGQHRILSQGATALNELEFSADGTFLAAASYNFGTARVWDLRTDKDISYRSTFSREVQCVSLSPDAKLVVSGSLNKMVSLWDRERAALLRSFPGHEGEILGVAVSPDGKMIASASSDGTARVWDVESGEALLLPGHQGAVLEIAFSLDGKTVLTVGEDQSVRFWPLSVPAEAKELQAFFQKAPVALNPDHTLSFLSPGPSFERRLSPCSLEDSAAACYQQKITTKGQPQMVTLGDIDGDQDLDLIVPTRGEQDAPKRPSDPPQLAFVPTQAEGQSSLWVFLNDGAARFSEGQRVAALRKPAWVSAADLDGDGGLDLSLAEPEQDELRLFWSQGGQLSPPETLPAGDFPLSIEAADLDGDKDLDLAVVNNPADEINLLFQDAPRRFSPLGRLSTGFGPLQVLAIDIDTDGDNDLIADDWRAGLGLYQNDGQGRFLSRVDLLQQNHWVHVRAGDLDGDADLDLVTVNVSLGAVCFLWNNGRGQFSLVSLLGFAGPEDVALVDLNKDDALDLVLLSSAYGALWILQNQGGGQFALDGAFSLFEEKASAGTLQVGDLNGDGLVEVVTSTQDPPVLNVLFLAQD